MGCAFDTDVKNIKGKQDNRRNRLGTIDCRKRSTKVIDLIV